MMKTMNDDDDDDDDDYRSAIIISIATTLNEKLAQIVLWFLRTVVILYVDCIG